MKIEPLSVSPSPDRRLTVMESGRIMDDQRTALSESASPSPVWEPLNAFLDSREFYNLMQTYRWADRDLLHPQQVVDAYEAVKDSIRVALPDPPKGQS